MPQFKFLTTAIGSLPHKDVNTACELILKSLPEIPFWPQLPKYSFYEGMVTQFSEGLPGIVINAANKKVYLESKSAKEGLEPFYEQFIKQNLDYFAITPGYAVGLYKMLELIKEKAKQQESIKYLKGQITGPITFGLTLTDETGQAVIHNEIFVDIILKCLLMKALWQVKQIKQIRLKPIIFLDEPFLMQYGSAYLPVNRPVIDKNLTELINALHKEDTLVGIHCCGNTDWGMLLELPIDILSFDAFGFMDKLALYPAELNKFILRGGIIAWGLIPSTEINKPVTAKELITHLHKGIDTLVKKGVDKTRLLNQALLTPACGLGGLSESEAEKRAALLKDTALLLH